MRRIAALRHRVPLRVQLVATLLLLVTVALVVMLTAASAALRGYLLHRVDQQLVAAAAPIAARAESGLPFQVGPRGGRLALPSQFYVEIRRADRTGTGDVILETPLIEAGRQPRFVARPGCPPTS